MVYKMLIKMFDCIIYFVTVFSFYFSASLIALLFTQMKCIRSGRLQPWGPLDAISLLPGQTLQTEMSHDVHGDSYTIDSQPEDLTEVLQHMEVRT